MKKNLVGKFIIALLNIDDVSTSAYRQTDGQTKVSVEVALSIKSRTATLYFAFKAHTEMN